MASRSASPTSPHWRVTAPYNSVRANPTSDSDIAISTRLAVPNPKRERNSIVFSMTCIPANRPANSDRAPTVRLRLGSNQISCRAGGSIPPAVAPHLLADCAGDAWRARLRRHDPPLGRAPGNFEQELGAGRFLELLARVNGNDEGAGAADHAVLVIDVEILDIHGEGIGPLEHQRQSIDGDAGGNHVVAHHRHERPAVVGAVARYVDNLAHAIIAAGVEQRFGELQRARDRSARRAPIGRTRDLIGESAGRFRSVDQPPGYDDFLVEGT